MKKRGKRKRSLPLHAQHPLPELVTIDVESVSRIPIISNAFSNPFIKCEYERADPLPSFAVIFSIDDFYIFFSIGIRRATFKLTTIPPSNRYFRYRINRNGTFD